MKKFNMMCAELNWDSRLNGSVIEVAVQHGHVILSGGVHSYPKKLSAKEATRRVAGVKTVANELKVELPETAKRSDNDIVQSVKSAIKWNSHLDDILM